MNEWTKADLMQADEEMAARGVPFHARAELAAEYIFGRCKGNFTTKLNRSVTEAYRKLFPEFTVSWPGNGTGFVNSLDRVRKIRLPLIYGSPLLKLHHVCGFGTDDELREFCRYQDNLYAHVSTQAFSVLWANNVNPSKIENTSARFYWQKSNAYLNSISDNLANSYYVGFSNSEAWLMFELAAKALLAVSGISDNNLRYKIGHQKAKLLNALEPVLERDDNTLIRDIVGELPDYTDSRFKPNENTRPTVISQASAAQLGASIIAKYLPSKMDKIW